LPLPSFTDLVRSYAPLMRGYPEFDPDEPRDESGVECDRIDPSVL
jgi:hypothetical protein